jgi:hypothetical protein
MQKLVQTQIAEWNSWSAFHVEAVFQIWRQSIASKKSYSSLNWLKLQFLAQNITVSGDYIGPRSLF